jgi:hypothetical protein
MINPVRLFLAFAGASALGVAALASAPTPNDNLMEIVIGNGPHAGTYKFSTDAVMCMRFKEGKNIAAVYKDFDASDLNKISDAAINVDNPDEAAPKWGSVLVAFGSRDGKRASYSVSIHGDSPGPITLTRNGKEAGLAFQGRTKDGISLHVTAKCASLEEL